MTLLRIIFGLVLLAVAVAAQSDVAGRLGFYQWLGTPARGNESDLLT